MYSYGIARFTIISQDSKINWEKKIIQRFYDNIIYNNITQATRLKILMGIYQRINHQFPTIIF